MAILSVYQIKFYYRLHKTTQQIDHRANEACRDSVTGMEFVILLLLLLLLILQLDFPYSTGSGFFPGETAI